jgi:ABC-type lipoprotein release transport system permease subunit
MHNIIIRIHGYDVSIVLFIIIGALLGTAAAATYMWTTKTIDIQIEEPLTVTSFPTSLRTRPGENLTIDITIENTATVTYMVTLTFTLNDTAYQAAHVTFSNQTYTIHPGTNNITAWMLTSAGSPRTNIQITTQFSRN